MSFGCSLHSSCLWIWLWKGLTIFRHLQEWASVLSHIKLEQILMRGRWIKCLSQAKDQNLWNKGAEKWKISNRNMSYWGTTGKKVNLQSSSTCSLWICNDSWPASYLHGNLWQFKKTTSVFPAHFKNQLSLWPLAVLR